VDVRVRSEGEPEQAHGHEDRSDHDLREAVLRLASPLLAPIGLSLFDQSRIVRLPDGGGAYAADDPDGHAQEGQANLPQVEAVVGGKDEREGSEEEVQDAE